MKDIARSQALHATQPLYMRFSASPVRRTFTSQCCKHVCHFIFAVAEILSSYITFSNEWIVLLHLLYIFAQIYELSSSLPNFRCVFFAMAVFPLIFHYSQVPLAHFGCSKFLLCLSLSLNSFFFIVLCIENCFRKFLFGTNIIISDL